MASPSRFEMVVVVGSQGAIRSWPALLGGLDRFFTVPIVIVQHRAPRADDRLADVLEYRAGIPVVALRADRTALIAGHAYVAPADRQVTVDADGAALLAPLDGGDPAARCLGDPLFASAAEAFGAGVIGIVLSGRLQDGARGCSAIKQAGGRVLVQSPTTSEASGMPLAALATGVVDLALPASGLGFALQAFVSVPGAADLFRCRPPNWASALPGNEPRVATG